MAINPRPSNIDRSLLQAPNDTVSELEENLLADDISIEIEPDDEGGAEVVAQPYEINTKQLRKNDLVRSIAALFASLCIICSTFLLRFCGWFNGL